MIYPIQSISNKKDLIEILTQCQKDCEINFICDSKQLEGNCLWSLWTAYDTNNKRHFSFIKLFTLHKVNDIYAYEEYMYETDFDEFTGCPLSFLHSAEDSPYIDQEWRDLVRIRMESRKPKDWEQCKTLFRKLSVSNTGERIRLNLKGLRSKRGNKSEDIPYVILESLNPLFGRYKGRLYEIRRATIVDFELIPPPRHPKGLL